MVKKKRKKKRPEKKKRYQKKEKKPLFLLPKRTQKLIGGIIVFAILGIVILSFFGKAGILGRKFVEVFSFLIGNTIYIFPLFLFLAGIIFLKTEYRKFLGPLVLAIFILILGFSGVLAVLEPENKGGGIIGHILSLPLLKLIGLWATQIIFLTLVAIGGLILWQLLRPQILPKEKKEIKERKGVITRVLGRARPPRFKLKEIHPSKPPKLKEEKKLLELKVDKISQKPIFTEYKTPPINLLEDAEEKPSAGNTKVQALTIKKTLENFGISVEIAEVNIGPTVTQYALKPAEGIKLSKITTLTNNLALALAAHPIRIEAPIPGRSLVGIEVPNKVRANVKLKNLISNPIFKSSSNLTFALGKDVSGVPVFADLAKMPHLLVAGATGSGKTIFLNSLILSLLYKNGPDILRLILVDPKRVEFSTYNKLPHLIGSVIHDASQTVICLNWLVSEMERRFEVLSEEGVRDIQGLNEKILKEGRRDFMPYIIFVVDELADLILAKGKEIESGIVRLAQLARAVGIHLVLATQRPSVEVITGLIKANITSRISFQVASQVDSRTILDTAGAEKLLGSGDMLFLSTQTVKPRRIQGAYVSEREFKRVVDWIFESNKDIMGEDELSEELKEVLEKGIAVFEGESQVSKTESGIEDSLYSEAKRLVIESKRASASFLQRKLKIGYARAARLIDMLEERGIVGPPRGSKPRIVYGEEGEAIEDDNEISEADDFGRDYDEEIT